MEKELTRKEIEEIYKKLKAENGEILKHKSSEVQSVGKWDGQQVKTLANYAAKVAKHSSLDDFDVFMRTGEVRAPIKLTGEELEVLKAGGTLYRIGVGILAEIIVILAFAATTDNTGSGGTAPVKK